MAAEIREALRWQPAVALLGPRQVGKTTLAQAIGRETDSVYLDLEDPDEREKLREARMFFDRHEDRLVILDEIHRAPELLLTLRGAIDRGRSRGRRAGRFLILGSASLDVLRETGETLAGRIPVANSFRWMSSRFRMIPDHGTRCFSAADIRRRFSRRPTRSVSASGATSSAPIWSVRWRG